MLRRQILKPASYSSVRNPGDLGLDPDGLVLCRKFYGNIDNLFRLYMVFIFQFYKNASQTQVRYTQNIFQVPDNCRAMKLKSWVFSSIISHIYIFSSYIYHFNGPYWPMVLAIWTDGECKNKA